MGGFLILLSMAAFVLFAVSFFRPFPRLGLTTKARSAVAVVGSFLLFAIGGSLLPPVPENVAAASPAAPVASPAATAVAKLVTVRTADPAIKSVEVIRETLVVNVTLGEVWSTTDYIDYAALLVASVGKAIQKGAPEAEGLAHVNFIFEAMATDRLGYESNKRFMTLVYSADDLRKARFDNLGTASLLNLATDVFATSAGDGLIILWCRKSDHLDRAREFCLTAVS